MRICLVNTYHCRRGGDSTYAFYLADPPEEKGHEVVNFGMNHPPNVESHCRDFFVSYMDYREASRSMNPLTRLCEACNRHHN
jgi:hypothetical protein